MSPAETPLDKRAVLARHEFFREAPPGAVERLAARARPVSYRAGQPIFARGDAAQGLLAIVAGFVRITVAAPEGRSELVLNVVGPNEVFGEIALLDDGPRTADAVAATACRLLLLERRDFLPVLADEPAMAVRMLAIVSGRLRRTSQQLQEATFAGAEQRLAKALLTLAGAQARNGARVLATQRELGHMVGLSRESTNRHLTSWQRVGHITLTPGACTIRSCRALQRIADGPNGG